eukprot:TRINITY_DN5398_c0_g1_i13.p1 TRINITY_DN5398_c0_g1~~TRINITY_DN5398_c0_g1_i13.p1  ORF type:complete len:478 (+),score=92.00 TRINITY_DN5398_c0_g1_i13:55-1434(+)
MHSPTVLVTTTTTSTVSTTSVTTLWKLIPPEMQLGSIPSPRYSHAACVWEGAKLIIFGGNRMHNQKSNETYCYHYETNTWSQWATTGDQPAERYCHTAEIWNEKMIVFGGFDGRSRRNDVCVLDLHTKVWSTPVCSGVPVEARSHHASCIVGNSMIIFGGLSGSSITVLNDTLSLDLVTMTWSKLACVGTVPCERLSPCIGVWKNKVISFGGYTGSSRLNTVHVLHLGKCMWSKPIQTGKIPLARYDASMTILGSKALLIGGNINSHTNDVHILDLETMEWKELESSPRNHSSHTASLMVNGKIVIWGSMSSAWNTDITILDTTRVPDLKFWSFEEAKKEVQMKLKFLRTVKTKEENKNSDLIKILANQFEYLQEEEHIISNNHQKLCEHLDKFEEEKNKMKKYELDKGSGVVKLNVGGQIFHTTLKTLNSIDGNYLIYLWQNLGEKKHSQRVNVGCHV